MSKHKAATEHELEGILWPRTKHGKALVDDYYRHDDAREGVGLSLGARIADIEAEAAADAHRKYLDIAATNGEIGLLLVETQTALAALVADHDGWLDESPGVDVASRREEAWDAARAALAATDVRGALAEAIERACADHNEECWFRKSSGIGADAILAALAAKGVEG